MPTTIVDDTDDRIVYDGFWLHDNESPAFMNWTFHELFELFDKEMESTIKFTFTGTSIRVYGSVETGNRPPTYLIDGSFVSPNFTKVAPSNYSAVLYESPKLIYRNHTVTIRLSDTGFRFDGFVVVAAHTVSNATLTTPPATRTLIPSSSSSLSSTFRPSPPTTFSMPTFVKQKFATVTSSTSHSSEPSQPVATSTVLQPSPSQTPIAPPPLASAHTRTLSDAALWAVIGGSLFILLVLAALYLWYRRRRTGAKTGVTPFRCITPPSISTQPRVKGGAYLDSPRRLESSSEIPPPYVSGSSTTHSLPSYQVT